MCEQSQVDFEEGGIDQGVLELLKSVGHFSMLLNRSFRAAPPFFNLSPCLPVSRIPGADCKLALNFNMRGDDGRDSGQQGPLKDDFGVRRGGENRLFLREPGPPMSHFIAPLSHLISYYLQPAAFTRIP